VADTRGKVKKAISGYLKSEKADINVVKIIYYKVIFRVWAVLFVHILAMFRQL
jgi:hypothetical protein